MTWRVPAISFALVALGVALFDYGIANLSLPDFRESGLGPLPIIGLILGVTGVIGLLAWLTATLIAAMAPKTPTEETDK